MVTVFNQPANTYLTNTPGGTVAVAEHIDDVPKLVAALEPWKTPILDKIMSNEEVEQEVHQWYQSYRIGFESKTTAAIADGTAVKFTVTAGDGALFQEESSIEVYEVITGTDIPKPETREVMIVKQVTGDELTVERAAGTPGVAHLSGSTVSLLGTTEPLNSEHTEAPRIRGVRYFNYPQRFQAKLTADKRNQNMPTWEHKSNPLLADFAEELIKQKMLLERSALRGVRRAGEGNSRASMFGGLDYFLQTNLIDMTGGKLTADTLDNVLADRWLESDNAEQLTIVCSMDTARILDHTIDPVRREYTATDDQYSKVVRKYHFRTGTFEVEPTRNMPNGLVYLLDFNNVKVRPFKGLNWHTSGRDGATHAVDHDVKAISGDFTMEVLAEHSMAKIYNFDGVLANYSTP